MLHFRGILGYWAWEKGVEPGGQQALLRLPLAGSLYSTIKRLSDFFTAESTTVFKRVVVVQYPREGIWSLGLTTGSVQDGDGHTLLIVYIPTTPLPNSGYIAIVPEEEVHETDIGIDVALKLLVSGGTLAPLSIQGPHNGATVLPRSLSSAVESRVVGR